MKALREARENLPEEPMAGEDTAEVRIRGPDGEVARTFYISDTTQVVLNSGITFKHTDMYLPTGVNCA